MEWLSVLNNREWAGLIWLAALVVWASFKPEVRAPFLAALKLLTARPILASLLLLVAYVAAMVAGLWWLDVWNLSHLKTTLLWTLTVAIASMFNINKIKQDKHFFRHAVLENFQLAVLVEFLVSSYVFPLPVELLLLPFVFCVVMMLAIAQAKEEYRPTAKLLNGVLMVIGFGLLGYAGYQLYWDVAGFATLANLIEFSLPIVLSLLFLPFIYLLIVYSRYEGVFVRLQFFIRDPALRAYARRQAILRCRLDLDRLDRFFKKVVHQRPTDRQQVLDLLQQSKASAAAEDPVFGQ